MMPGNQASWILHGCCEERGTNQGYSAAVAASKVPEQQSIALTKCVIYSSWLKHSLVHYGTKPDFYLVKLPLKQEAAAVERIQCSH